MTAWDKNPLSIENIERIKAEEGIVNLQTAIKDLNNLSFEGEYDFILSTVVLMFLEAKTIPGLIDNMQRCTRPGGYNLIVAAMDTADYPCTVGFPFAFKSGGTEQLLRGLGVAQVQRRGGRTAPHPTRTVTASNCVLPRCWRASRLTGGQQAELQGRVV